MKRVAVAIVHGHAPKWLQTVIHSLKSHRNDEFEIDIFVRASWPDHPSLKAITETALGDNVSVKNCEILWRHGPQFSRDLGSHATGLEEVIDEISYGGKVNLYDYFFTLETDCKILKDNWLDWYYGYFKHSVPSEPSGMAGFMWKEGHNHYNINPSATLYDLGMLIQYHKEVRENKDKTVYHWNTPTSSSNCSIYDVQHGPKLGVFSEVRGFADPNEKQLQALLRGIPNPGWFEPGAWLYCRALGEWGCYPVRCDHVYKYWTQHQIAPRGSYYGGIANPYVIHYWGGTRAWDELKHDVEDAFVAECSIPWKKRENDIWLETVPVEYRQIMPDIYKEMGVE